MTPKKVINKGVENKCLYLSGCYLLKNGFDPQSVFSELEQLKSLLNHCKTQTDTSRSEEQSAAALHSIATTKPRTLLIALGSFEKET